MLQSWEHLLHITFVALYLPGLPRAADPPRSRWRLVDHAMRQQIDAPPAEALRSAGMWLEAGIISEVGLWDSALAVCASGRAISPVSAGYPAKWLQLSFAPPALWIAGEELPHPKSIMAIVGSRALSAAAARFAREAARAVGEAGSALISGGASGADREAARGIIRWAAEAEVSVPLIQIVPFGIGRLDRRALAWERGVAGCVLSLAAPEEGFSSALAMERNALLYAAAERSLVVAARLREGGTWAGATAALRRRSTSMFVREDGSPSCRALEALGASPLKCAASFPSAEPAQSQMRLVG